jgi:DNA-binding NtrC family response regulator
MANILVVDDQACVRQLISEELVLEGHQVRGAGDVKSVRERLQSCKPDLVLLDLYLEGPQGFGLLQDIKSRYPHLPVIIVSAYDSFRDDPRVSQADGYVVKNIRLDTLKKEITRVLRHQEVFQAKEELVPESPKPCLFLGEELSSWPRILESPFTETATP